MGNCGARCRNSRLLTPSVERLCRCSRSDVSISCSLAFQSPTPNDESCGYSIDKTYNFYTNGRTDGIYSDKTATFAGVFTQRYEYSTRGGGTNEALVLVGYFAGQAN